MSATFEAINDPKAPVAFRSEDGLQYMTRGNVDSDTIVIFLHTTGDWSGMAPYYNTFYGWEPDFYAVALDRPGDFGVDAIPCTALKLQETSCAIDMATDDIPLKGPDCSYAYLQLLQWTHSAITTLIGASTPCNTTADPVYVPFDCPKKYAKVVLAGHSYGGVQFEEYIRWRSRMGGEPKIDGLILISNPSADTWGSHIMSYTGDWNPPEIYPLWTYTMDGLSTMCGMESAAHNYNLGEEGNAVVAKLEINFFQSDYLREHIWMESSFTFNLFANSPNKTAQGPYAENGIGLPHVVWSEHEHAVTALLTPKLLVYSRTSNTSEAAESPDGYYYAWPDLQADIQAKCTAEANCALSYVDVPDWKVDAMNVLGSDTSYENASQVLLWGHLVMISNSVGFRAAVEPYVASL